MTAAFDKEEFAPGRDESPGYVAELESDRAILLGVVESLGGESFTCPLCGRLVSVPLRLFVDADNHGHVDGCRAGKLVERAVREGSR